MRRNRRQQANEENAPFNPVIPIKDDKPLLKQIWQNRWVQFIVISSILVAIGFTSYRYLFNQMKRIRAKIALVRFYRELKHKYLENNHPTEQQRWSLWRDFITNPNTPDDVKRPSVIDHLTLAEAWTIYKHVATDDRRFEVIANEFLFQGQEQWLVSLFSFVGLLGDEMLQDAPVKQHDPVPAVFPALQPRIPSAPPEWDSEKVRMYPDVPYNYPLLPNRS